MRPAMGHADRIATRAGGARQAIVALVAVELQRALEAMKECLGVLAAATGGVEEDHPRRIFATPSSFIARKGPEVAGLGAPPPGIEDRRGGLIHEEMPGGLQMFSQPIDDGPQVEPRDTHPIRERAAVDGDARPGEHLALTV